MGRCAAAVLGAVLVLGALAPARAELSWSEFAALRKGVRATAKKPGESSRKHGLLRELQKDDTARAAELLLAWIAESRKLTAKLERKLAVETKKLIRRRSDDRAARETRRKVAALASQLTFERKLLASLTAAAATFRNGDAVKTLLDESRRDVKAASELAAFRRSLFELCKRRRASEVTARLCTFALDEGLPEARLWVLRWIAAGPVRDGYAAAVACLAKGPSLVRREAIATVLALDDPRCVPALVQALQTADGIVAAEMEGALHLFTGKTFRGYGSAEMWARWWAAEGEAWLAGDTTRRFEAKEAAAQRGPAFYGIRTRSNRIVFVLDRSSSMMRPLDRGGPVSGTKRDDRVPGRTRFEVAQSQLARSIRSLRPDVRFAVIFYDTEIVEWRPKGDLMPATPPNKKHAIDWVMDVRPRGATLLFDALRRALRYVRLPDGADTIFLLTDGHPTNDLGQNMPAAERNEFLRRFLDEARPLRCIVHTIGVGPGHATGLMERLAEATGGRYRAVGMR